MWHYMAFHSRSERGTKLFENVTYQISFNVYLIYHIYLSVIPKTLLERFIINSENKNWLVSAVCLFSQYYQGSK